jgi:hypothetical protein
MNFGRVSFLLKYGILSYRARIDNLTYLDTFRRVVCTTGRCLDVWFLGNRMQTIVPQSKHTITGLSIYLVSFQGMHTH